MEESESKLCLCDSKAWALSKNLREINSSLFSSQINSEIKEFNCGRWEGMAEEILSLKPAVILGSDFSVVKPLSIQGTRSMALLQEKSFENHK